MTETRLLTPNIAPGATYPGESMEDGRALMQLSPADHAAFAAAIGTSTPVIVTDVTTGTRWSVVWAPCGGGCQCAATATPVPEKEQTIMVRMEETCIFSRRFTVAELARQMGVEPTMAAVTAALDGEADCIDPGDALVDVMESGYDGTTSRIITRDTDDTAKGA